MLLKRRTALGLTFVAGGLTLLACGGPPVTSAPAAEPPVDLAPRPPVDAQYEILHRETRGLVGEPPAVIETRTLLRVLEVLPDGSRRVRARLHRSAEDSERGEPLLADQLFDFVLSPSGELKGSARNQCEGATDTLRVDRYLRHLFGARAFVARGVEEGTEWRDRYLSDATELATPAIFHVDEVTEDRVRGRLRSRISLDGGDVGAQRVTGDGTVRGRFTVSRADGFRGMTDVLTEIRGEIVDRDAGRRRRGVLQTRSQILVRTAEADDPPVPVSLTIEPATVVRHIRSSLPSVQACYEERLREDPTLTGRVMVRFSITPDGHVHDVTVPENDVADPAVADCVTRQIRRFRFAEGPACRRVFFAYPFVFAPQT